MFVREGNILEGRGVNQSMKKKEKGDGNKGLRGKIINGGDWGLVGSERWKEGK